MSKWTERLPLWASRPTGDGFVSYVSVPTWLFMIIVLAVLFNVIAWSMIGLVEVVQYVL